jgi:hypothetical protein
MLTVTAETSLSSSPQETWTALGRRTAYLCFPGMSRDQRGGSLRHELDLPLLERRQQAVTLWVSRAGGRRCERRFALRGDLLSIAGTWRMDGLEAGARARVTLDCDIAPHLVEEAVHTLRGRSPLPLGTDADAILRLAVDEFFHTRLTEHAAAYCARVGARLDGHRS